MLRKHKFHFVLRPTCIINNTKSWSLIVSKVLRTIILQNCAEYCRLKSGNILHDYCFIIQQIHKYNPLWKSLKHSIDILISSFLYHDLQNDIYHSISVVAKKLGCRLKIKLRRLKEGLKCPLCFTDSSPAKNPAGNLRFFSRWISPAAST